MTRVGNHLPIWDPAFPNRTQFSFVDIERAYSNADIDETDAPTFVSLPEEDPDNANMCGRLFRHMHGTRGAADVWQEEYSTTLIELGFEQGPSCPNVPHHPVKKTNFFVHGCDFTSEGGKLALDWFEQAARLGPGPNDAKEGTCLNRIIR